MELVLAGIISDEVIDRIEVEVPGTHVEALTSASSLIQELDFSLVGWEKKQEDDIIKRKNGGVLPVEKEIDE